MYKNKIIDKAQKDIEIKKEGGKIEERKKNHTYHNYCFINIYRFAEDIKEASDIAKRENENEY